MTRDSNGPSDPPRWATRLLDACLPSDGGGAGARADLVGVRTELETIRGSLTWRMLRQVDRWTGRG